MKFDEPVGPVDGLARNRLHGVILNAIVKHLRRQISYHRRRDICCHVWLRVIIEADRQHYICSGSVNRPVHERVHILLLARHSELIGLSHVMISPLYIIKGLLAVKRDLCAFGKSVIY